MFGFRRNIAFTQRSRGVGDIQRGVYSMYVYCDVCKEKHCRRYKSTTTTDSAHTWGYYVCERYETSIYATVQRTDISNIKIDITDDTG